VIIDRFIYKKENIEILKKKYLSKNIFSFTFSIVMMFFFMLVCIVSVFLNDIMLFILSIGGIVFLMFFLTYTGMNICFLKNRINLCIIEEKLDNLLKGERK